MHGTNGSLGELIGTRGHKDRAKINQGVNRSTGVFQINVYPSLYNFFFGFKFHHALTNIFFITTIIRY